MELLKQQKYLSVFVFVAILAGCETHLDTPGMEIIGNPPTDIYFDSEFEFEFGASGGNGPLTMRYIANPPPDVLSGETTGTLDENPIALEIEDISEAKPAFLLKGTHPVPAGEDFDSLTTQNYDYQLELSDGAAFATRDFEFTLQRNRISLSAANSLAVTERRVNDAATVSLAAQRGPNVNGFIDERVCEVPTSFEPTVIDGTVVYPATFRVDLDAPVASRTELVYEFKSEYNPELPERDEDNIGLARPNVDFLATAQSVIFERGERFCYIQLNVLDDSIIEGLERLEVEFTGRVSGAVAFDGVKAEVRISDNEPTPSYSLESTTVNEGEEVVATVSLDRGQELPLTISVEIDLENSTADVDDYEIVPPEATLTFAPDQTEASFSVRLLNNDDGATPFADEVLIVSTDIGDIRRIDPMEITINQWPLSSNLDNEVVARQTSSEQAVGFDVDDQGRVVVLKANTSAPGETRAVVDGYYSDGTPFNLLVAGSIELSRSGIDLVPKAIATYSREAGDVATGTHTLAVVSEVNGLFGARHYGGTDFVLHVFEGDFGSTYSLSNMTQYGTEGDDFVSSVRFDSSGNLFVNGETDGSVFEASPGTETNNGGTDGFVYRFNAPSLESKNWSRFIGTENDDGVTSVAAGRSDVFVLLETTSTDKDGFVEVLSSGDGETEDDVDRAEIRSFFDDNFLDISFSQDDSVLWFLADSPALLPDTTSTPSFTRDVSLVPLATSNTPGTLSELIATTEDDFARKFVAMRNADFVNVAGETLGIFEDNVAKGATGTDAFVSSFPVSEGSNNLEVPEIIQFGTEGADSIIDMRETEGRKIMLLWSEDSTSGDGSLVYRLSAFAPDGRKLSLDP